MPCIPRELIYENPDKTVGVVIVVKLQDKLPRHCLSPTGYLRTEGYEHAQRQSAIAHFVDLEDHGDGLSHFYQFPDMMIDYSSVKRQVSQGKGATVFEESRTVPVKERPVYFFPT